MEGGRKRETAVEMESLRWMDRQTDRQASRQKEKERESSS